MREREVVLPSGRVHALFPGLLLAVSLEAGIGACVTGLAVGAGVEVGLGLIKTSPGSPAEDHHSDAESIILQGSISEPPSIALDTSLSYAASEFDASIQMARRELLLISTIA